MPRRSLRRRSRKWHAKGGSAIVLDPRNGQVLAMANAPGFDSNDFPTANPENRRNRAVTDLYEPGSTFKLVTISGALEDGIVTPQTRFLLQPTIHVADRVIHDAEARPTERMSVAQILTSRRTSARSRSRSGSGRRKLARWISRWGFGKTTGVDFPGESAGLVLPLDQWSGSTIGTVPIGLGIAVTADADGGGIRGDRPTAACARPRT